MYDITINDKIFEGQKWPDFVIISYRYTSPTIVDGPLYRSFTTPILLSKDHVINSQIRFAKRCELRGDTIHCVKLWTSTYPYFEDHWKHLLEDQELSFKRKLDTLRKLPETQVRLVYESTEHKLHVFKIAQEWKARQAKLTQLSNG